MGYLLSSLAGLAAVAAVLWLTGAAVERRPSIRALLAPRGAWRLLVGAAAWTAWLFALGAVGLLGRASVLASAAAAAGAGLLAVRREAPGTGELAADRAGGASAAALALGLAMAALLAGLVVVALNPSPAWDAQVYHLTVPRAWLAAGGIVRLPLNVYSTWPLNFQLLYAGAMAGGGVALPALLHWGCAVLLAVLLWRAAGRGPGGAVAAGLLLANEVVLFEARAAYVDLAVALGLLAAWLLVERALAGAGGARALLPAGVALAWVAGAKPTGLAAGAALVGVVATVVARRDRGAAGLAAVGLGLGLPALLGLLPWLGRCAWLTGNPVYPFLFSWFGGPEWSEQLTRDLVAWQRGIGMGRNLGDYLLLPWRVIVAGGEGYARFDGRLGLSWLAALPLALAMARGRPAVARPLAAGGLLFALWALGPQQMRFLLPVLPLLALAAGRGAGAALAAVGGSRRRAALAWLVALGLGTGLLAASARERERVPLLWREYARFDRGVRERAVPPLFRRADELLPAEARLLLVGTSQAFFCPRPCLADSFLEASQIGHLLAGAKDPAGAAARLRQLGVTHLAIDRRRGVSGPGGLLALAAGAPPARRLAAADDGSWALVALR